MARRKRQLDIGGPPRRRVTVEDMYSESLISVRRGEPRTNHVKFG